jgi:hypothetical protein
MSERQVYQLVVDGDSVVITGPDGALLSATAIDGVHILVRKARTQIQRANQLRVAHTLRWKFPAKESDCRAIHSVVYAIGPTSPTYTDALPDSLRAAWPGVIKIGYTNNSLMGRCSALSNSLGGALRVYAFAYCSNPREAEGGMHAILAPHRIYSEWFDRDHVMGYLTAGVR